MKMPKKLTHCPQLILTRQVLVSKHHYSGFHITQASKYSCRQENHLMHVLNQFRYIEIGNLADLHKVDRSRDIQHQHLRTASASTGLLDRRPDAQIKALTGPISASLSDGTAGILPRMRLATQRPPKPSQVENSTFWLTAYQARINYKAVTNDSIGNISFCQVGFHPRLPAVRPFMNWGTPPSPLDNQAQGWRCASGEMHCTTQDAGSAAGLPAGSARLA